MATPSSLQDSKGHLLGLLLRARQVWACLSRFAVKGREKTHRRCTINDRWWHQSSVTDPSLPPPPSSLFLVLERSTVCWRVPASVRLDPSSGWWTGRSAGTATAGTRWFSRPAAGVSCTRPDCWVTANLPSRYEGETSSTLHSPPLTDCFSGLDSKQPF